MEPRQDAAGASQAKQVGEKRTCGAARLLLPATIIVYSGGSLPGICLSPMCLKRMLERESTLQRPGGAFLSHQFLRLAKNLLDAALKTNSYGLYKFELIVRI
jgi:hypothetical protein